MFARRRPLLRTAAVGGVAYVAGQHAAKKSAEQSYLDAQQDAQIASMQQQQAQAAPPAYQAPPPVQSAAPEPASSAGADTLEQLKQLGELRAAGVLTDAEFEATKQKILGQL